MAVLETNGGLTMGGLGQKRLATTPYKTKRKQIAAEMFKGAASAYLRTFLSMS